LQVIGERWLIPDEIAPFFHLDALLRLQQRLAGFVRGSSRIQLIRDLPLPLVVVRRFSRRSLPLIEAPRRQFAKHLHLPDGLFEEGTPAPRHVVYNLAHLADKTYRAWHERNRLCAKRRSSGSRAQRSRAMPIASPWRLAS
jgi:hypothetical protein